MFAELSILMISLVFHFINAWFVLSRLLQLCIKSNFVVIFSCPHPRLHCKDIIRQPSEDEIIKLAPPPKKAWGCGRQHWYLHLDFFTPINWLTVSKQPYRSPPTLLPLHTKTQTRTHTAVPLSVTHDHTSSHLLSNHWSDGAPSQAEGKNKSEDGKMGEVENRVGVWGEGESQRAEWVGSDSVNCSICDAVFM